MHRFQDFRRLTDYTDPCSRSSCLPCFPPHGSLYSAWTPPLPRSWAVILLCATGSIGYLPVPVLTAIVISALLNVVEVHLAVRLFRVSRQEFYDLDRNRAVWPVKNVLIYRFSENLFFANIKILQSDIENNVREDTKAVILDAGAVNSIDITAADGLVSLADSLQKRRIRFYITEHSQNVNDQFRKLGIGRLIREGIVRRTVISALYDMGMREPFPLDIPENKRERARRNQYFALSPEEENSLEEFAWAFGSDAVREIEKQVKWIVEQIHGISDLEQLSEAGLEEKLEFWHSLGPLDEDELLRRMELHIDDLPDELKENSALAVRLIERRRRVLRDRILREYPNIREHLQEKREVLEQRLQKQNPEGIRKLHELENQQEIRNSY